MHHFSRSMSSNAERDAGIWTDTYFVHSYEVDPTGAASIKTVCNYLQETAGNHAGHLDVSVERLGPENRTWVLSRLHVEMDRYPQWRHRLHVETWPSGENGLLATREFLLFNEHGERLGRATSAWLMIDIERRRPVRLPDYISEIDLPARDRVLPATDDLPVPEEADYEESFRVRYSDLDLNGHANNVNYAEWAVETLPGEIIETGSPLSIEIQYRAETSRGDAVRARASRVATDPHTFEHRLIRTSDEREVARIRTRWPRSEHRPTTSS